jgi:hypothetical protein
MLSVNKYGLNSCVYGRFRKEPPFVFVICSAAGNKAYTLTRRSVPQRSAAIEAFGVGDAGEF